MKPTHYTVLGHDFEETETEIAMYLVIHNIETGLTEKWLMFKKSKATMIVKPTAEWATYE